MEPVLASVAVLSLVAGPQAAPRTRPEASPLTQEINREEARHHYRAGDRLMAEEAFERAAARFRSATQLDPAKRLVVDEPSGNDGHDVHGQQIQRRSRRSDVPMNPRHQHVA